MDKAGKCAFHDVKTEVMFDQVSQFDQVDKKCGLLMMVMAH
jgi:hypothetical protein